MECKEIVRPTDRVLYWFYAAIFFIFLPPIMHADEIDRQMFSEDITIAHNSTTITTELPSGVTVSALPELGMQEQNKIAAAGIVAPIAAHDRLKKDIEDINALASQITATASATGDLSSVPESRIPFALAAKDPYERPNVDAGFNLEVQHPRERPPLGLDSPDISWADC